MSTDNRLHAGGNADFVAQLRKQQEAALKEINSNDSISKSKKSDLIRTIRSKFKKLIAGSTGNLHLSA